MSIGGRTFIPITNPFCWRQKLISTTKQTDNCALGIGNVIEISPTMRCIGGGRWLPFSICSPFDLIPHYFNHFLYVRLLLISPLKAAISVSRFCYLWLWILWIVIVCGFVCDVCLNVVQHNSIPNTKHIPYSPAASNVLSISMRGCWPVHSSGCYCLYSESVIDSFSIPRIEFPWITYNLHRHISLGLRAYYASFA